MSLGNTLIIRQSLSKPSVHTFSTTLFSSTSGWLNRSSSVAGRHSFLGSTAGMKKCPTAEIASGRKRCATCANKWMLVIILSLYTIWIRCDNFRFGETCRISRITSTARKRRVSCHWQPWKWSQRNIARHYATSRTIQRVHHWLIQVTWAPQEMVCDVTQ